MPRRVVTRQRRPHRKSRTGCASCKALRVKCDEQGPPCTNCSLRQRDCRYLEEPRAGPSRGGGARPASGGAAPRGLSRGARETLELELMHRWCTRTYTGFLFSDHEYAFATVELPRTALGSDMLLSFLFASAALDLAATQSSRARALDYTSLAMAYYDRSVRAYRDGAGRPSRDTHWIYSALGLYMANFHLGFMQATAAGGDGGSDAPAPLLRAMRTAFAMMHSASRAARQHLAWFFRMPYPFAVFARIAGDPPPAAMLDDATRASFARLRSLNAKLHPGAHAASPPATPPAGPPAVEAATYRFYQRNIALLERLWAEEARGLVRANFWFFPPRALADKPAGCQPSEAMELMVLLHWAVLLHQSRRYYWWVGDIGTRLMAACCDALRRTPVSQEPEVQENMEWVWLRAGQPRPAVMHSPASDRNPGHLPPSGTLEEAINDRAGLAWVGEAMGNLHV